MLMPRIADILAMDISTLSRNLKPLERDGAIRITRLATDRRVRVATLAAQGQALLEAAWPLWNEASASLSQRMGAEAACDLRRQLDLAAASVGLR